MAKQITSVIKLNIPAGKGTPAPPVGPALGQAGINMMEFLKKFNEMTSPQMGYTLPVEITVFSDRSYAFVVKQPLTSDLIKRAAGIESHVICVNIHWVKYSGVEVKSCVLNALHQKILHGS